MSDFSPLIHDIFIVAARMPTTCFQIQYGMLARVEKSIASVLEHLKQALRSSNKLTPNGRAPVNRADSLGRGKLRLLIEK